MKKGDIPNNLLNDKIDRNYPPFIFFFLRKILNLRLEFESSSKISLFKFVSRSCKNYAKNDFKADFYKNSKS